ncbi:hypothetical protein D3C79_1026470 [compost metagenome]
MAPEFVRRGMEALERMGIVVIFVIVLVASPFIGVFMRQSIGFFVDLFGRVFGVS